MDSSQKQLSVAEQGERLHTEIRKKCRKKKKKILQKLDVRANRFAQGGQASSSVSRRSAKLRSKSLLKEDNFSSQQLNLGFGIWFA